MLSRLVNQCARKLTPPLARSPGNRGLEPPRSASRDADRDTARRLSVGATRHRLAPLAPPSRASDTLSWLRFAQSVVSLE